MKIKTLVIALCWQTVVGTETTRAQLYISTLQGGKSGNLGTVEEYSTTGTAISTPLISGTLGWPGGMVIGSDGYLYVVNNGAGSIGKYTLSGATVNASLITGLFDPWGIAFNGGNLYVASGDNNGLQNSGSVGEYTTSGQTVNASLISGLSRSYGIATDGSDLFVTEQDSGVVAEYTTTGTLLNPLLISGLTGPFGIALGNGNIYVGTGSTVGIYTMAGAPVNATLITGLSQLAGFALDGQGDLFVAELGNNRVGEYTIAGDPVNAALISVPNGPAGLAVVPEPSVEVLTALGAAMLVIWRPRPATSLSITLT